MSTSPSGCSGTRAFIPPNASGGEKIYTEGSNYIIADDALSDATAGWFLNVMLRDSQRIGDFFGTDFPAQNHLTLKLLKKGSVHGCRNMFAAACVSWPGEVVLEFSGDEISYINKTVAENKMEVATLDHELSHALRFRVAAPWHGLEEGLAEYTTQHLGLEGSIGNRLSITLIEDVPYYRSIPLQEDSDATVLAVTPPRWHSDTPSINVAYEGSFLARSINDDIPLGYFVKLSFASLVVRVTATNEGRFRLEVIHSNALGLPKGQICEDDGYRESIRLPTQQGVVDVISSSGTQMSTYAARQSEQDMQISPAYASYACFWERIHQTAGDSPVRAIIHSMLEFSKKHQDDKASFPFFQTVQKATGMTEDAARNYFAIFSLPMADSDYPLGGLCWPDLML